MGRKTVIILVEAITHKPEGGRTNTENRQYNRNKIATKIYRCRAQLSSSSDNVRRAGDYGALIDGRIHA